MARFASRHVVGTCCLFALLTLGAAIASATVVTVPGDYPSLQAVGEILNVNDPPDIDTVLVTTALEPADLDWNSINLSIVVRGVVGEDGVLPIIDRVFVSDASLGGMRFEKPSLPRARQSGAGEHPHHPLPTRCRAGSSR